MIVTFCGHRDFSKTLRLERALIDLLENFALHNNELVCYCGGYGNFDSFSAECVKKLQRRYDNIHLCLIVPYFTLEFQNRIRYLKDYYDEIIYPPLENVPSKYAISRRNEWMVDNADVLIAYVRFSWGGAASTLSYAQKKCIAIYHLNELCK